MLRAAAVGTAMMLTAAGCKNDTPSAPIDKKTPVPVFTGIETLQTYLEEQGETTIDKPIAVRLSVDLSNGTASRNAYRGAASEPNVSIESLFAALAAADKYVDLDLSGCTGLSVWARYTDAGAGRIVSLVLPDSVTMIADGANNSAVTFSSFSSLKTLEASGVYIVGKYTFYKCAALASLSLPSATTIGGHAFEQCPLETVSLPAAVTLGGNAFADCSALETLSLPALTTIGDGAFTGCAALKTASLPNAAVIGTYAFATTAFETLSLPAAVTLGNAAFYNCRTLASANLPAVTAIGQSMFSNCYALESLTLGTALPTIIGTTSTVFGYAGRDSGGFTIYVPADGAKAVLEAAIDDDSSAWHKAVGTTTGKFNGVAVKR
jgi:hypothetical protein